MTRTAHALAEWDTAFINDLPDSSFAIVLPGGEKDEEGKTTPRSLRKLPYKDASGAVDLPHLRNALARLPQSDLTDEQKDTAQAVLDKAADESLPSRQEGMSYRAEGASLFANGVKPTESGLPDRIWVTAVGDIWHPDYRGSDAGPISVTLDDLEQIVANFDRDRTADNPRPIPIDINHASQYQPFSAAAGAIGWIGELSIEDGNLWASDIEWNVDGQSLVNVDDKRFKYTSPVIDFAWEDRQTGEATGARVSHVAVTNNPAQGGGVPIAASFGLGSARLLGENLSRTVGAAVDALVSSRGGESDDMNWVRDGVLRDLATQTGLDTLSVEVMLRGGEVTPSIDHVVAGIARVLSLSEEDIRAAMAADGFTQETTPMSQKTTDPKPADPKPSDRVTISLASGLELDVAADQADAVKTAFAENEAKVATLAAQVEKLQGLVPKPDEVKLSATEHQTMLATVQRVEALEAERAEERAARRREVAVTERRISPEEAKTETFMAASADPKLWGLLLTGFSAGRVPGGAPMGSIGDDTTVSALDAQVTAAEGIKAIIEEKQVSWEEAQAIYAKTAENKTIAAAAGLIS